MALHDFQKVLYATEVGFSIADMVLKKKTTTYKIIRRLNANLYTASKKSFVPK